MQVYDAYDPFAATYQRHWGPMVGDRWLSRIEESMLRHITEHGRILDLCCGTGELSRLLAQRGYRVTGLDGSSNMLELARTSAPDCAFVQADVREFTCEDSFDGCLCMFDSLNHLMSLEELTLAFANVHHVLNSGGIFYFDVNMHEKYAHEWAGSLAFIEDDHVCAVECAVDVDGKRATFTAAIFCRLDKGWQRRDVHLVQTWYAAEEISASLQSAGFRDIETDFLEPADAHRMFVRCIA